MARPRAAPWRLAQRRRDQTKGPWGILSIALLFCILDVEAGDNPLPVLVGEERDRKWRPWLPLLRGRVLNKDLHGGP